jgi:YNFM family putative membrane transporter
VVTATYLDWHVFFLLLGVALLIAFVALGRLRVEANLQFTRPSLRRLRETLQTGAYLRIYGMIFCLFFAFIGLTNFLPFRVVELWGEASQLFIGLIYTGFLVGLLSSLGSGWAITRLGSPWRAMQVGLVGFMAMLALLFIPNGWLTFGALFPLCGAMFLAHATAAGLLNQLAVENKGLVNGLYIAAYYAGGVCGTYLPGLAYEAFGWNALVLVLLGVTGAALGILSLDSLSLRKSPR